jgi:hypothetical protein
MSWLASFVVALLTAAVGLVLGGYLASLAVGWYRVSSFEGGAGYFVVAFALLGFVVGLWSGSRSAVSERRRSTSGSGRRSSHRRSRSSGWR